MARKGKKTVLYTTTLKWLWLFFILAGATHSVLAQNSVPLTGAANSATQPAATFALLEPSVLPSGAGTSVTTLSVYAKWLFITLLTVIIILAVLMFTWGGIEYMLSEALPGKLKGKERMLGAVYGLLLALVSWLILNAINPDLVTWNNNTLIQAESSGQTQ